MVASVGPYRFVNVTWGSRRIQWMTAGVEKTSPHHRRRFKDGKSSTRTTSNFAKYVSTDGTENHCINSALRIHSASLCGSTFISGGAGCSSAPTANAPD